MKPIADPRPGSRAAYLARRLVPLAVLVVVAAAAWYGWQRWRGGAAPLTYTTTEVVRGSIVQSVTASGTLSPVVRSTVGSQVSGRLTEVLVDYNDRVTRGQVLARLDRRLLEGQVAQARARLASARAELVRAQASAESARLADARTRSMATAGAASTAEVEAAHASRLVADAAIQTARSSIALAQAALDNATTDLAYTTITAPIDGVVISRSVDAGQTVAASLQAPELFVIAGDLTRMELHAAVAEADVGLLHDGMRVELAFDAWSERTFAGTVRQIRNQAQTTQGVVTYDAVVAVDNPDGALRPGMTATATFVIDEAKDVLVVPSKALRYRPASARTAPAGGLPSTPPGGAPSTAAGAPTPTAGPAAAPAGGGAPPAGGPRAASGRRGGPAVWVLRGTTPTRLAVTTGLSDGDRTAITGGELREGDRVITADSATPARSTTNGNGRSSSSGNRPPGPPPLF